MRLFNLAQTFVATALLFASGAQAEQWTKTWTVSGKPELHISTADASVQIEVGSSGQIEAQLNTRGIGIGGSDGLKISEHQTGDRVELEVREPNTGSWFRSKSINLQLRVPRELMADIHTGDGSINMSGLHGNIRVNTGDGSVQAHDLDGIIEARSGDGSMNIRGRFDRVQIRTSDGSVDFQAEAGSKMQSDWRLETGDGSVHARIPKSLSATLQLRTGDGSIHADLPITDASKSEHDFQGKLNGGGAYFDVRTGDGSIGISAL